MAVEGEFSGPIYFQESRLIHPNSIEHAVNHIRKLGPDGNEAYILFKEMIYSMSPEELHKFMQYSRRFLEEISYRSEYESMRYIGDEFTHPLPYSSSDSLRSSVSKKEEDFLKKEDMEV